MLVIQRPHLRIPDLNKLVMKNFASCNKEYLHGFIYVREFKNWRISAKNWFKLPKNKENLEAANRGEYNYISVAYDVRGKEVILPSTAKIVFPMESLHDCDANDLLGLEVPTVVQVQV